MLESEVDFSVMFEFISGSAQIHIRTLTVRRSSKTVKKHDESFVSQNLFSFFTSAARPATAEEKWGEVEMKKI